MGVVHHMHHLAWFEMGRTELMRAAGAAYIGVEDKLDLMPPVVEVRARHLRPARYDELLEVRTRVGELGNVRLRFDYRIVRAADEALLAEGFTVHAAVTRGGRPRRAPSQLREKLALWERER